MKTIILASASPRRAEILSLLHIPFSVSPTDADETLPAGISCEEAVAVLSKRKATAIFEKEKKFILAADTLVSIEGQLLGKPKDDGDAFRMLSSLSGKTHTVYTGVALSVYGKPYSAVCKTNVTFRSLSDADILAYIKTGEPRGKAGAYAIQGQGSALVSGIEGDYFNVVGLPVSTLVDLFLQAGMPISEWMGDEWIASSDLQK